MHLGLPSVPDDSAVENLPQGQVDYLSHVWKEEDVWRSWRNMTRQKNAIANGTRLENASWRTWWKQRNKLKTISPETLNWLKDSDVTWLYGPLHSAAEAVPPLKTPTAEERLGLVGATNPRIKPILKHRSILETLTNQQPSSPFADGYVEFDYEGGDSQSSYFPPQDPAKAAATTSRSHIPRTKSDTNLLRYQLPLRRGPPARSPVGRSGGAQSPLASHTPSPQPRGGPRPESPRNPGDPENPRKHISFNTFVEQCIAIEKPPGSRSDDDIADEEELDEVESDDDDDDDALEFKSKSSRTSSLASAGRLSRPTAMRNHSYSSERSHVTIAPIPPTILKSSESFPDVTSSIVYAPPQGSLYSNHPPPQFELEPQVAFSSGRAKYTAARSSYPRNQPESEDEEYMQSTDFDFYANATPDLAFGDQFPDRGRPNGAPRRRHHPRASPSPDPGSQSEPVVDIARRTTSPDLLGVEPESRGRSSFRGSSGSLSDRSRSGSRNRVDSSSPIGSISPSSSRSGSSYNVRKADLARGSSSLSPPAVVPSVPSPKASPPNAASPGTGSPLNGVQAPTLRQAMQKEPIVRPSLVINRDQLPPGGSPSSAESGASPSKREDPWPDVVGQRPDGDGLVGRAVDIVSSARGMIRGIFQ